MVNHIYHNCTVHVDAHGPGTALPGEHLSCGRIAGPECFAQLTQKAVQTVLWCLARGRNPGPCLLEAAPDLLVDFLACVFVARGVEFTDDDRREVTRALRRAFGGVAAPLARGVPAVGWETARSVQFATVASTEVRDAATRLIQCAVDAIFCFLDGGSAWDCVVKFLGCFFGDDGGGGTPGGGRVDGPVGRC